MTKGVSYPRNKEELGNSPQKGFQGSLRKEKGPLNWGKNLSSAIDVTVGVMGGENVPLQKT